MMNYCFWYGGSKPSDLEWLGNAIRLLKENKWDGQSTLYFDGRGWGENIREEAAISLLQALRTSTSVKSLYLRQAVLDVKAETALSQVFETNEHLERIVLRGIQTTSGVLQLPECLFKNPSLRKFDFTKGSIGSASLAALSAVLLDPYSSLTHLSLDNVELAGCFRSFTDGVEKSMSLCSFSLKNMHLSDEQIALLLNALGKNQSITSLSLDNLNLGSSHIDQIATLLKANAHLQELSLRRNAIDGKAAGILFSNPFNKALRSLRLSQNPLGDQGAHSITSFLKSNTSLETLCLMDCKIGDVGCRTIAQGLNTMKGIRKLCLDSSRMEHAASFVLASLQNGNDTLTAIRQPSRALMCSQESKQTWEQIEMHLRWNKCGRRILREEREDLFLANVLQQVNSDPDLLYAFLKASAIVC